MDWFVQRAEDHKDELEYEAQVDHAWCMWILTGTEKSETHTPTAGVHRCGDDFGRKPLPISRKD